MPAEIPPILITQHMPPVFTGYFAERLNKICPFEVKEAADGDEVVSGRVLIAPGDFHMLLTRHGNGLRVRTDHGPQVCYQRPAVDVMFASIAEAVGKQTVAALLTAVRLPNVDPKTGENGLELQVIAAVVVGGVAISGWRGTLLGTLIGVALLGTIRSSLVFLGAEAFWDKAIQGGIILLAVASDALSRRAE